MNVYDKAEKLNQYVHSRYASEVEDIICEYMENWQSSEVQI